MRFGEIGVGLNRAGERVSGIRVLAQLDEDQTHAIPRYRVLGRRAQNLAVRFEC